MRAVLVTGGAGFIGSGLVHHLIAHTDAVVTVLDKLTGAGNRDSLTGVPDERLRFVRGDVCDVAVVDELVAGQDVVVHCAAESHNDAALRDPRPFVDTNIVGTAVVLEACRRHDVRLHHVSTDEVFGDLALDDPTRFTEASPYRPSSPYAASKASADHLVRAWVRSFGLRATLSSCSNTYGPRQHVEKLIPRQVTNILDGRRPRLYGSGAHVRDWIHVEDHSAAVLRIIEAGRIGETYLVGADGEHSNREVLAMVLQLMGQSADAFDHVRDRPGHDVRYAIDATRLRHELGWRPQHTDLEAGLSETITWYREHEAWWRPHKATVEQEYEREGR
ncbi:dTDP-glucose 4,6-dehydratase [Aeromicrobium sp. CF4.19]|uniref:dTDP-glucose 4,6-dehydratase n=1 Tax=Aeromicrobium sp. CF4.19 TaxID=3373082 RepID=UPI003EE5FA1D